MDDKIEISTINYILSSELESINNIDIEKIQQNNEIKTLDIKFEDKILRINIFDLLTFCTILEINLTENDLKKILKQYSIFRKNSKQLQNEQMLYMEYLDDLNGIICELLKIYKEINFDNVDTKDLNDTNYNNVLLSSSNVDNKSILGGLTIYKLTEDIINNLNDVNLEAIPKLKRYTKKISIRFNDILKHPNNYSKEECDVIINRIQDYQNKIININKYNEDIKDLSTYFKNSEFEEHIENVINSVETLSEDLNILNHILTTWQTVEPEIKQKINENSLQDTIKETIDESNNNQNNNNSDEKTENQSKKINTNFSICLCFCVITIIVLSSILIIIKNKKRKQNLVKQFKNKYKINSKIYTIDNHDMLNNLKKLNSSMEPKLGVDIFGDLEVI